MWSLIVHPSSHWWKDHKNETRRTEFGADQNNTIVEESVDMQGVGRAGGLKPFCIDTGMSCAERDEKREKEIDAFAACFVHLG